MGRPHGVEKAAAKALKSELSKLETASEQLMDRIFEAEASLVASYDKRLAAMEKEKIVTGIRVIERQKPLYNSRC